MRRHTSEVDLTVYGEEPAWKLKLEERNWPKFDSQTHQSSYKQCEALLSKAVQEGNPFVNTENFQSHCRVLLLGDFKTPESRSEGLSAMQTFLDMDGMKVAATAFFHAIKYHGISFEFFILKNAGGQLFYRNLLLNNPSVILLIPNSEEDFGCCINIVKNHAASNYNRIYYLNSHLENSEQYAIIEQRADFHKYHAFNENVFDQLSGLVTQEYMKILNPVPSNVNNTWFNKCVIF